MDKAIPITPTISWIGANDRETDLFEGLWSLPRGVSYNSYLICDDKVALIDTVKSSFFADYLGRLQSVLQGCRPVDYLIVNHMEPDHSGSIRLLRSVWPELKIVGNRKTLDMVRAFYGITEGLLEVRDGDVLDLGSHKLTFALIPMVHWPETMVTYDTMDKVLFTCDAFGGFGALEGGVFDDEVDMGYYESEILRYFSNIVGRYSSFVQKAISRVRTLDLKVICPSHGPILRSDPMRVVDLYDRWSCHETEAGAVVVYGSMYGNTKRMSDAVARSLSESGIRNIVIHDAARANLSFLIRDIWRYRGLVLASCTYNTELFPPMAHLTQALANKMMKNRVLGVAGCYSWSRGALTELISFAEKGEWELVEPHIEVKSAPTEEDLEQCALMGKNLAEAIRRER
jgi:flavorubredoxin